MNSHKLNSLKSETVSFRISHSTAAAIKIRADLAGKNPNEWVRDIIEERLDENHGLSPSEQILHREILQQGELCEAVFKLMATGELNAANYYAALLSNVKKREGIVAEYFDLTVDAEPATATDIGGEISSDQKSLQYDLRNEADRAAIEMPTNLTTNQDGLPALPASNHKRESSNTNTTPSLFLI